MDPVTIGVDYESGDGLAPDATGLRRAENSEYRTPRRPRAGGADREYSSPGATEATRGFVYERTSAPQAAARAATIAVTAASTSSWVSVRSACR